MAAKHVQGKEVYVPNSIELEPKDKEKFQADLEKMNKKHDRQKRGRKASDSRGVVYLGHIPKGFFEPQMKRFFSQFGKVTRLRLSRSKKTGQSKGYAFIEFADLGVAKVVADTMNNYLMFMKLLKCQYIEPDKVHADTFKGCYKKFTPINTSAVAAKRNNNVKNEKQDKRMKTRQARTCQTTKRKLLELGIEYSFGEPKVDSAVVAETVKTPSKKLHVLKEDATDTEITFKTPPDSIKSSRLNIKTRQRKLPRKQVSTKRK